MSAPNFNCYPNAKRIYAFCLSDEYEEYVDRLREEEDDLEPLDYSDWYDDEKEYHLDDLAEQLRLAFDPDDLGIAQGPKRYFRDGYLLASVTTFIEFAGDSFPVEVSLRLHSGYYEGFSIDWHAEKLGEYDRDVLPTVEECEEMLAWRPTGYGDWTPRNKGLAKCLAPKLEKRIAKAFTDLYTRLEAVLDIVAPHKLVGHCMSNGEGFYTEVA